MISRAGVDSECWCCAQSKRTNVAIALVGDPRVLFLDEPTSGLDSYTSCEVIEVIKKLTFTGIIIIAILNSPTPRTFELFRHAIAQKGSLPALIGVHIFKNIFAGES